MSNELTIIDPKEFGLEETKATEMTSGLKSIIEERNSLEGIYDELIKQELNAETLKQAKALRIQIRDNRTKGIEPWHKTNKAFYLAGGRFVDAVKNKEIVNNERMEAKLEEIEQYFIKQEQEAKAKLKLDREAKLLPFEVDTQFIAIADMSDEQFEQLLSNSKLAFETKAEQARQAELARIETERLAEEKRQEDLKAEQERLETQRLENERLKAEADKREKEMQIEREKLAKEQAEKDRLAKIESDKQAKILADAKAEADKLAKQLKDKEEAERIANEQEKARIEAEEADKLAKEKALLLAPDKEKVKVFFEKFKALEFPGLESEAGILMTKRVTEALQMVKQLIIEDSKTLL